MRKSRRYRILDQILASFRLSLASGIGATKEDLCIQEKSASFPPLMPDDHTYIWSHFRIAEASTTTHRVANASCYFSHLQYTINGVPMDSPVQSRIVDILTVTLSHEPKNLVESFRSVVCVNFAGILRVLWRCHRKNRYEPRSFISIQPSILAPARMKYLSPASLFTAESLPFRYWLSRRPKPSQVVFERTSS